MRSFARFLILFGFFCLLTAGFLYWRRITPQRLRFNATPQTSADFQADNIKPDILTIEDLGISLNIYPSEIKNGRWEATSKGVSYLASSPPPGDSGNSILYGHNWINILGRLKNSSVGQTIKITYTNGKTKNFKITHIQIVTPDQTDILNNTKDSRITLYTCTGFLDTKRFVVTAILDEAS